MMTRRDLLGLAGTATAVVLAGGVIVGQAKTATVTLIIDGMT